ncbi:helix-turn-helix transcriptional regulator [Nonomuraea sp. NPDC052116]|uniref:helix-turn-helix domain-containing protein n=1 Tax=Nonomuraea sp. NPDC052116 TaxID=3155665 RepID=UPI003444BC36
MMIVAEPDGDGVPTGVVRGARSGPTALRIMVGTQLRRLREAKGITGEKAADTIRASHSKISRMELGRSPFKQRDVADLLTLYGITAPGEREKVLELARQASAPGWWHQYSDVLPGWLEPYLGLEQAARTIRNYEAQSVHGLLQCEPYARAVIGIRHGDADPDDLDRRVAMRMRRQDLLTDSDAPILWAIMDEAVLTRPIGGRDVQRAQLEHLLAVCDLPNVTLQIVPFHIGGHAAVGGPFTLLRFDAPDLPDVVYLEHLTSAMYLDKPTDIDDYSKVMNTLTIQAAPKEATPSLLKGMLEEL